MTVVDHGGWRRLHPLTIVKEMGAMAWAVVVAIFFDFDWEMSWPGLPEGIEPDAVIAVGVFAFAIVRYLFTAYRLTDQSIDLRRGVLVKTNQSMPRDRVQTVAVTTGLIGRFVGVTTVEVSAADTEDIRLAYVSVPDADHLRHLLESDRFGAEEPEDVADAERVLLSDLDPGGLIVFALTEGGLLLAILLVLVGGVVAVLIDFLLLPFLVAATVGGWPVIRSLGLVGFRSWLGSDRIRVESGLLSRRESEAPLARVQLVGVSRPLLRRLLGLETVEMTTGELTISRESVVTKGMVAPLVEIGAWRDLARQLIGPVAIGETELVRSSPYTKRRAMVRGTIGTALVSGVAGGVSFWFDLGWWLPALVALAGLGLTVGYSLARYRVLGWATDHHHLMVRKGVLSRRLSIVPIRKVQDVEIVETFFQRRLGLATVEVDTAGVGISSAGNVRAIDLTREDARVLAEHLVTTAARIALPDGV